MYLFVARAYDSNIKKRITVYILADDLTQAVHRIERFGYLPIQKIKKINDRFIDKDNLI